MNNSALQKGRGVERPMDVFRRSTCRQTTPEQSRRARSVRTAQGLHCARRRRPIPQNCGCNVPFSGRLFNARELRRFARSGVGPLGREVTRRRMKHSPHFPSCTIFATDETQMKHGVPNLAEFLSCVGTQLNCDYSCNVATMFVMIRIWSANRRSSATVDGTRP